MPGPVTGGGTAGTSLSKASGAEVNIGTDDAKYVTPKALTDSDYAKTSDIPAAGPTNSAGANVLTKSNGTNLVASPLIAPDANTVEQRNGATGQTFSNYATYTDASNYVRLTLHDNGGGIPVIESLGLGTGGNPALAVYGASILYLGGGGGAKWQISSSGDLVPLGTFDVASSGSPARTGYFGTSVVTPKLNFSATVTPSSSVDAQGSVGDVRYDDNFIYIKTAGGGWKRVALSTF